VKDNARDTQVSRKRIKDNVRRALWARTAGRCTICNRLMSYLRTMQAAGLLRQVGAVYEFRHKMLRERLAWRYHHPR